jgi:hypothetical protein
MHPRGSKRMAAATLPFPGSSPATVSLTPSLALVRGFGIWQRLSFIRSIVNRCYSHVYG